MILKYNEKDEGPYMLIAKYEENKKNLKDIIVGKKLKNLGFSDVKITQLNKFSVKIMCEKKNIANKIIEENWKKEEIKVYIPYNIITKSGVIYDIPLEVNLEEMKSEIESEFQILEIKRMIKRNNKFNKNEKEWEK